MKDKDEAYAEWMAAVDQACQRIADVSCEDLPDYCYRDAYDDGVSPTLAARRAIAVGR